MESTLEPLGPTACRARSSHLESPSFLGLIGLLVVILGFAAHAADFVVAPGQSIQAAIQSATHGDRVLVKPGTYHEAIDFQGKSIQVIGEAGASATVLDGTGLNHSVVAFQNNEAAQSILRGFRIVGGAGTPVGSSGSLRGGAILAIGSTPLIDQCELLGNSADYGGGACADLDNRPTIRDSVIESNVATRDGGGLYGSWSIERCKFVKNTATHGGGLAGTTLCVDSSFLSNAATIGAGVSNRLDEGLGSDNQYERCVFRGNIAEEGGGAYQRAAHPALFHRFVHCRFENNAATIGRGGGLWLAVYTNGESFPAENPLPEIEGCVFANNVAATSGDGAYFDLNADLAEVANNTFYGDSLDLFGVLAGDDGLRITNCIFANSPLENSGITGGVSFLEIWSCVFPAPVSGKDNIAAAPNFVDAPNGDFRLAIPSPAIDSGTLEGVTLVGLDIAGHPRVLGSKIDRGAYEFTVDCDHDGIADFAEIAANPSLDCDHDNALDDCPNALDCDGNGRPDKCDIAAGLVPDCNHNWIPDACDAQSGGDLDGDGVIDDCSALLVPQQYATIQAALDQAIDGAVILLADGTYSGPGNVKLDPKGKAVTLRSRHGSEHCALDGKDSDRLFFLKQPSAAPFVVEGLTLRNGAEPVGGSISLSNGAKAVFRSCVIEDSRANYGGAVSVQILAHAEFNACVFRNCQATKSGGAAYVHLQGRLDLRRCTLVENRIIEPQGQGTAIAAVSGAIVDVQDCILANPPLVGVLEGSAEGIGTALQLHTSLVKAGPSAFLAAAGATLVYGAENLSADPGFVGPQKGEVHLRADSIARDRGSFLGLDFEGDPSLGTSDLGADEFQGHVYPVPPRSDEAFAVMVIAPPSSAVLAFLAEQLAPYPIPTPYGSFWLATPLLPGSPFPLAVVGPKGFARVSQRLPGSLYQATLRIQTLTLGTPPRLTNFATLELH